MESRLQEALRISLFPFPFPTGSPSFWQVPGRGGGSTLLVSSLGRVGGCWLECEVNELQVPGWGVEGLLSLKVEGDLERSRLRWGRGIKASASSSGDLFNRLGR